jgi:hypothetical protein
VTLQLQAKDAAGNNLTAGGLTVAFSASGGTSTGTIGSTTDNANGKYTATFTGGTAGTATTIGATINTVAVTSTLPTVTVTSASAVLVFDPNSFADDAAMKAWPSWTSIGDTYWIDPRTGGVAGVLDPTVGYGTGTKSLRVDFQDMTANGSRCTDYTPAEPNLNLPSSVTNVWVEIVVMFTPNFTTISPGGWSCTSGNAYKILFGRVTPSGVFENIVGSSSSGQALETNYPGSGSTTWPDVTLFDGQWHVLRYHFKADAAGAGVLTWWVDGVVKVNQTGLTMPAGTVIYGLGLGRNLNHGPAALQSVRWGRVSAYTTDPGW